MTDSHDKTLANKELAGAIHLHVTVHPPFSRKRQRTTNTKKITIRTQNIKLSNTTTNTIRILDINFQTLNLSLTSLHTKKVFDLFNPLDNRLGN